jgi:Raf kinase inhibitor-like YbhB/YbcL family protein
MSQIAVKTLSVKSKAFQANGLIPVKYTCEGENINPPIHWGAVPDGTRTMALIMEDPDAPRGTFVHWIMWNVPANTEITENSAPGGIGKNGNMENNYYGPCPPSGEHHYHFKLYALDTKLDLPGNTDKGSLMNAMEGHVLASGDLIGIYKKSV